MLLIEAARLRENTLRPPAVTCDDVRLSAVTRELRFVEQLIAAVPGSCCGVSGPTSDIFCKFWSVTYERRWEPSWAVLGRDFCDHRE
jgi:hypothetical protein